MLVLPTLNDSVSVRGFSRRTAVRMDDVLQRIQGEFVEMPGLRLTPAQAQRLWGLERDVCDALLGALVDAKFLAQTRDGAFIRLDGAQPTPLGAFRGKQSLAVA